MSGPTFSRAPLHMRYNRESYFEPRFVSIGPLYSEKLMDQSVVEKAKDNCISYFTRGLQASPSDLLSSLVQQIINAYDKVLKDRILQWYGKIFVHPEEVFQMLVRDSCFIIRIILAFSREGEESMFYPGVDIKTVRFDLLLMENQIPFFFLRKVYDFLTVNKMLPQSSENSPSNSPENDSQSNPQGNTCMCCLPMRKRRLVSQSTAGQSHITTRPNHEPQSTIPSSPQGNTCMCCLPMRKKRLVSQSTAGQSHITTRPSHGPQSTIPSSPQGNTCMCCLPMRKQRLISQSTAGQSHITTSPNHIPQSTIPLNHNQSRLSQSTIPPVQTTTLSSDEFLKELKPFIWLDMPWKFYERAEFTEPKHLLDLYWKWCIKPPSNSPASNPLHNDGLHASWVKMHLRSNARKRIKSAYELYRKAGVTFKKIEHEDGFDVKFQKGILEIPHLQLDPNQTTLLANLVAFEEFKPSSERLLTSYVLLLDGLINTEKDVELLQRHGVITNKLYSSQLTASIYFNDIGNVCSVDYNDHYCRKQFDDLNSYYHSKWNNQFAKLRHKILQ